MAKQNKGRKLFATAASAALVATALTPAAFAAETTSFKDADKIAEYAKESVEYLVGKGAISGYNGSFNPKGELTRAEAATILAKALDLKVDESKKTTFEDAKDHWASEEIAALQAHNKDIITGFTDGTFRPDEKITRAQLALIITTAYGLKQDESAVLNFTDNNAEWSKGSINTLASLGIVAGTTTTTFSPNAVVTREQAAAFFHRTEVPAKRLAVETTEVKVTSVSVLNNKQVEVKFNQPVGKIDISNFTRNSGGTAVVAGGTVQLSDDKKTATLNLQTAAAQQESVDLTIKGVQAENGKEFAEHKATLKFFDNAAPEVKSVSAIGNRDIEVVFTEPLKTSPTVKVTVGTTVYQPSISLDPTGTKGTVTLPSDLTEGTHKIEVSGGSDYSSLTGYVIEKVEKEFTYVKDSSAVVATVKTSTENSVTLKFNKPLKTDLVALENAGVVEFSHTYKGQNAAATVEKISNDEFKVTFTTPFAPGNSTLYFDYAANTADANKVKDGYGNILSTTSWTIQTVADFVKPEITSVEQRNANTLRVTFSETVQNDTATNGARNTSNYTLKDSEGKNVAINSISAVANTEGKVFDITTATLSSGGNYTLEVKNVKDLAQNGNTLDTVTKTIAITDKVAPTVTGTATVLSTTKIRIDFSEAMDRASIEDKKLYSVDSKVKITATSDNKAVVLDYTDYNAANAGAAVNFVTNANVPGTIQVGRVKDAAGNETSIFVTSVTVTAGTPVVNIDKAELTALDTVKVTLKDIVSYTGTQTLEVSTDNGANWVNATIESNTGISGKSVLVLKLADADKVAVSNSEATGIKVRTGELGAAKAGITNVDGAQLSFADTVVKDAVGPIVTARALKDADNDGKVDSLEVTFSEAVYASSVAASDFTVQGYVVKGILAVDNVSVAGTSKVVIELEEKSNTDLGATPVVTVGEVEDLLGNKSVAETTGVIATAANAN